MEQMTFRELSTKMMALYTEGNFADALHLVEQNAADFPEQLAHTNFWKMCLLSLTNRQEEAVSVFQQSIDSGLWWAEDQFLDPDLNNVRDLPEFQRLMAVSQKRCEEARTNVQRDQIVLVPEPPASTPYPLLIALHGHSGNMLSHIESLEAARQKGWLVLSPQSTQLLFPGAYRWDDAAQALEDLLYYHEQVIRQYPVDPERIVIAGFSQGSGMSILAAMSGQLPLRGFIGVASYWAEPGALIPQTELVKQVRGYFVLGDQDHTLATAKEIQKVLKENQIQFAEEMHAGLRHEYPADFASSFDKAIDFIFKEQE